MGKADTKVSAISAAGVDDFASAAAEGGPKLLLAVPVAEPGADLAAPAGSRRQARKARKEAMLATTAVPAAPPGRAARRRGRADPAAKAAGAKPARRSRSKGKRAGARPSPSPVVRKAGKGMAVLAAVAAVAAAVQKFPVQRWARHTANRARGLWHQCIARDGGRDTSDRVVADRIRSSLGPLEHELEVPRINVLVENGVALLHGDVGSDDNARRIVDAVSQVVGVRDVRSNLRPAYSANDPRPSDAGAPPVS